MDGHKYRQVLFNLVGNAVKFSDNGRITIKGSVVSENEECYTCKIEVIDEGWELVKKIRRTYLRSMSK